MNEYQKQARADAYIKASNSFSHLRDGNSVSLMIEALAVVAPQAHESVQNGTCDEVAK